MQSNLYTLAFLLLLLMAPKLMAEYRSYQYVVSSTNIDQKNLTIITTSFNPVAMTHYYGISPKRLYLLRTWLCPGSTAHQKICTPPYQDENLQSFILEQSKEVK